MSWLEISLRSTEFSILLIYHIHLIRQLGKAPIITPIGPTKYLRLEWVQSVRGSNRDILAVQTMRNWVMASSFFASTVILISMAIIKAAFRTNKYIGGGTRDESS